MIGTTGYENLKASVESDCNERKSCGCFNPDGCPLERASIGTYGEPGFKSCFHKYCDKFKWVIDRANHYAEKTGMDAAEILNAWEEKRNYWYMNYYQECNQPEIKDNNVRIFNTLEDLKASIGEQGYRCPNCKGISTDPYECDSGVNFSDGSSIKKCDWKSYGLFGTLGQGATIFVKEKLQIGTIFMPIAWEESSPVKQVPSITELKKGAIVQFRVDWNSEPTPANTSTVNRVAKDKSWVDVNTPFGSKRVRNPLENLKIITDPMVVHI
ncbi:hypothetical protein H9635_10235 [Solibacillus sp. A46]|uniref:Uncharacterized protein n=1 Tax=Solibacillus faecavium TaxID=2762221 RepID=A0ABR8XYX0_9BACL|nr:hypothetical protein [Solibacillus faecavium]MBD8037124.1 hypothetical protein [Solibacillus faecavium]